MGGNEEEEVDSYLGWAWRAPRRGDPCGVLGASPSAAKPQDMGSRAWRAWRAAFPQPDDAVTLRKKDVAACRLVSGAVKASPGRGDGGVDKGRSVDAAAPGNRQQAPSESDRWCYCHWVCSWAVLALVVIVQLPGPVRLVGSGCSVVVGERA